MCCSSCPITSLGWPSSITKGDRSAPPISVTAGLLACLEICDVPDAMDLILLVIKADDLETTRAEEGKSKLVDGPEQSTSCQSFCLPMTLAYLVTHRPDTEERTGANNCLD